MSSHSVELKAAKLQLRDLRLKSSGDTRRVVELAEVIGNAYPSIQLLQRFMGDEVWTYLEQVSIAAIDQQVWPLLHSSLKELLLKFPNSSRVHLVQGMMMESLGEFENVTEFYNQILASNPTDTAILKRQIVVAQVKGDMKGAISLLVRFLEIFYTDVEAWAELSWLYEKTGMMDQSIFSMEECVLLQPQNSHYVLFLAEKLLKGGKIEKSYPIFCRSCELLPNEKRTWSGVRDCAKKLLETGLEGPERLKKEKMIQIADKFLDDLRQNAQLELHHLRPLSSLIRSSESKMSAELAPTYAALILADAGLEITAEKIQTLITAAGIENSEPIWGTLLAKALAGKDVMEILTSMGSGGGAAAPAPTAGGAASAAAPAEEKKEEKVEDKEESDEDMGFGLFD